MMMSTMLWLMASCMQSDVPVAGMMKKDARLKFSVVTSTPDDALVLGNDGSFSSLALFIFNKADGTCEYAELIPEFTPAVQALSRSVNVSPQTKVIYAMANYNVAGRVYSTPISSDMTMEQLESLTVSDTDFRDTDIMMVGKAEVGINSSFVTADVPMERLAARVDIYLFKNGALVDDVVEVTGIEYHNQVLNTYARYRNEVMIAPAVFRTVQGVIVADPILKTMPGNLSDIIPYNAHTSFYTYQNLVPYDAADVKPDDTVTPYLRITTKVNGVSYIYKGYITDNGHNDHKYSVMRNTVYCVRAMLQHPDNELTLNTIAYPWTVSKSEIGSLVTSDDYQLTANEGDNHASYSSYAGYKFRLTAPAGAVWVATLTNGLNFAFATEGSVEGTTAVSKGIARADEYEIRVKATRPWNGNRQSTRLYITVNGEKLNLNPLQSDGTRRFPGESDTDILITQSEDD